MRVKFILSTLACGALSAALSAVYSGCASCETYAECTSKPGLRQVTCGSKYHAFNDGAEFESEAAADEYCYCSPLACTDGGTIQMCNRTPEGGVASVTYQNGTVGDIAEGVEVCRGLKDCQVETARCSFSGWYLRCSSGSGPRFVTAGGEIVNTEQQAVGACVITSDASDGYCDEAVTSCVGIDCNKSVACRDDFDGGCEATPYCGDHDSAADCIADPACRWELY